MGQKTEFLGALADSIELTPQTASALTTALRAYTVVIDKIISIVCFLFTFYSGVLKVVIQGKPSNCDTKLKLCMDTD